MKQPIQNLLSNEHTREIREFVKATVKIAMIERGKINRAENLAVYAHTINAAECGVIEALLEELDGNQSAAAVVGGLSRSTVRTIISRNALLHPRPAQPLPVQQQQSNADTRSMAQKFKFLWGYKAPEVQWVIANTPDEGEYEEMMGLGINIDKTYHDGGGKAVAFADGSIYRSIYWGI